MVRVISVHHFASQDIHTCEEPLAVTTAPNDRLLLALPQHAIEVRDLRKGGNVSHVFPTVDEVTHMIHCCNGNYIATLEAKKNRQGKEASYARVYANWDVPSKVQPMRARIAGRVTPSSSQSGTNSLEMIELPVKRAPNIISCCQVSGNLLVGSHKTLVFYKYHIRTHDISKQHFLDFEETLSLELSFCPSHVFLCEDVVSCISKENFHVFCVSVEVEGGEERGTRDGSEQEKRRQKRKQLMKKDETPVHRSPIILSEVIKQASTLGSGHQILRSKLHQDSFPIVVHLPTIVEHNKNLSANQLLSITQRAGPFRDAKLEMNVKVLANPEVITGAQIYHILCLQIHACSRAIKEEFRCLKILPMYVEQPLKGSSSSSHPMHSSHVSQLVSLAVAVTTQQEGYMYHVNYKAIGGGQNDSDQDLVSPPTIFPFTAPVASVALERSILHALTETGLETYTGRAGHHLMQLLNNKNDGSQMAYPPVEDPICLVGLRPFFGVEHLLVSESYLCLLACSETSTSSQDSQGGGGWTLYSLQLPTASDLYQDIAQVAAVHRTSAPSTYLHLLAEAHVVLGTARRCLNWRTESTSASTGSVPAAIAGLELTPEANRRLERCYQESCALLADHYIMGDNETLWDLAKPYYTMSGLNATQVVDRFLRMEETKEESIPDAEDDTPKSRNFEGLMHFLRGELPGKGRGVRIRKGDDSNDFPVEFASQLLELFEQHDPSSVSSLVLCSPNLRQHRMDRVLQVMKRRLLVRSSSCEPQDPQDALALVLLCIQKGSIEQARTVLGSLMGSTQLVHALHAHHGLLFSSSESRSRREVSLGFTELALLVAEVQPAALASVLTQMTLDPSLASQLPCAPGLTVLTRAFLTPPCTPTANTNLVLRLFLESFFSQLPSHYSSSEVSEGVCILARSYMASLLDPSRMKGKEDSEDDLFGARLSFLDKMPPYSVDKAWHAIQGTTPPQVQSEDVPNHSLLKLQSLLCCPRLGRECSAEVLQFLQAQPQTPGCLALRALCLSPKEATCQLLDHCPGALLAYAKERYISESDWKYLLSILQKKLSLLPDESPVRPYYSLIMTETLSHLSQTLALDEFLRILPGGEAAAQSAAFQPFVHACQHVQSANHIRTLIMATGQQLLASLNL